MLCQSIDILERLVNVTTTTNLIALDRTMLCIERASHPKELSYAAARAADLSERITRACFEIGMCLPPHQRASS
jgi:hypothetical protein